MRWIDINQRPPTETDADARENVVTRYFVGVSIYFELEDYCMAGGRWITATRCEWLDVTDSGQRTATQKESSHIRKVEL